MALRDDGETRLVTSRWKTTGNRQGNRQITAQDYNIAVNRQECVLNRQVKAKERKNTAHTIGNVAGKKAGKLTGKYNRQM